MQEERFIILKMVEEGKINSAEAMALLEALEAREAEAEQRLIQEESTPDESTTEQVKTGEVTTEETTATADQPASDQPEEEPSTTEETTADETTTSQSTDQSGNRTGEPQVDFGTFSKEIGDHIRESVQTAMKNLPQLTNELKEAWESTKKDVVRSVAEVRDELSRGVSIDIGGVKRVLYKGRVEHVYVDKFEGAWADGESIVPRALFTTRNGSIAVRGWDRSDYEVTIRTQVRGIPDDEEAKKAAAEVVNVLQDEDGIEVNVKPHERVSASIEAYLPNDVVCRLEASTRNGGIIVEQLQASDARVTSTNGGVTVNDVTAQRINVGTTNGRILLESVKGDAIDAKTTNGGITWSGTGNTVNLKTTNGSINMAPDKPEGAAKVWAQTTNASIHVTLPADEDLALSVEASGTPVKTGDLAGIDWAIDSGDSRFARRVAGQSPHFENAHDKLALDLRTSNGSVHFSK